MKQNGNVLPQQPMLIPAQTARSGSGNAIKIGVFIALLALGKVASMANRGAVGTEELRLYGIVIAQILLLVLSIWKVDFVYSILLIYLPFSQRFPGDYGTAVNIANILIVISIFGLFLRSVKEGGHFLVKTELDSWIGLWLLLTIFSFARAALYEGKDWFLLITLIKRFCTPVFMYYLTSWIVRDRDEISNAVFVIMLTVMMVAFLATKDTHTPTHFSWERREAGVVNQANSMAAFMAYYMFFFYSFYIVNASQRKFLLLLPCLYPCMRSIMISFSRGGYVSFVVSALFVTLISRRGIFLVVAVVMLFVWAKPDMFVPQAVVERIQGTLIAGGKTYETSAQSRIYVWKAGARMILSNPIVGVGYGQFVYRVTEFGIGNHMDAHNGYILIAAEMGLPALFVFLMITGKLFRGAIELYRTSPDKLFMGLGLGFAACVVSLWVANIFGSRFNTTETISYFWILAAMLTLARKLQAQAMAANARAQKKTAAAGNGARAPQRQHVRP